MENEKGLVPYHTTDPTGKRTLVLAPHPDDETIGCGGTLVLHADAGDSVKVVFLTNGAKGDPSQKMEKDSYVRLRQEEARKACADLGVRDIVFWPFEDRSLAGARGALRRMMDLLENFRPELVYVPSPLEFHPDHRAAAHLFCDAVRGKKWDFEVAFYEVSQPISVNRLVDITPVMSRKMRALEAYQSQLEERHYEDVCTSLARFRTFTLPGEVIYAEGFSVWEADFVRKAGVLAIPFQPIYRLAPHSGEAGPLVSVVVRTRNRPHLLSNAIRSIAQQTYANLEIVVVNDGGEDVRHLAEELAGEIPVVYVCHERSLGRAGAANAGIMAAHGTYVNFLDDDDILLPEHVEKLVNRALAGNHRIVYSSVLNVHYDGPPENPGRRTKEEIVYNQAFNPDLLLFENYIPLMSVLLHRDVLSEVELFSQELDLFEDWDFWVRLSRKFDFHHVDEVTAEYRFYETASVDESYRRKYEFDKAQEAFFDRVKPYLDGRSWMSFLNQGLVSKLRKQVKEIEARYIEERETRSSAEAVLKETRKEVQDRSLQVQKAKSELQALSRKLVDKEKQLKKADEWLKEGNARIREKDLQLARADEWLKESQAKLRDRETELRNALEKNSRQDRLLRELREDLTLTSQKGQRLEAQAVNFKAQLEKAYEKIRNQQTVIESKNMLLEEIFSSKGWLWLTRARRVKQKVSFRKQKPGAKTQTGKKDASLSFPASKAYHAKIRHPLELDRPKVVHAIANLMTGGSSRLIVDLFEHLGHIYDQEIVSFFIPDPPEYEGVTAHDFSKMSAERIERFLREKNPALVHVHYWGDCDDPWYAKIFDAVERIPCRIVENINTPVAPLIREKVDRYVYVSRYAMYFADPIEEKSSVIYPGSDLGMFQRNGAPVPDNAIGMVYRLEGDKLRDDSIEVFIEVVKRRPKTQAYIVGGGSFLEPYKNRVASEGLSGNFVFTGYIPYEQLPAYYRKFSLFVAPVWKESFGQVSPFAMNMEIPVVGYDVGALSEILGGRECLGKDRFELVEIIVALLNDRKRRIEIGKQNRERVQRLFSVEVMVENYRRLYMELLDGE